MSAPGAMLNQAINLGMACTWLAAGLQVVLGVSCRHDALCSGRVFFAWLLVPQAVFTVLVLRTRGISWRFSTTQRTPSPTADQPGGAGLAQQTTLPLGMLSTLLCGGLSAEMLHGLGSSSPLASVCFVLVAVVAAVSVCCNCLVLHTMPALELSERQYSAVLTALEDDKI